MASSAAKRYAQAIFSLGKERNTLDAWQGDLAILDGLVRNESIATYLANPSVTADRKLTTLESALGANVQPETRNLAKMLIERHRAGQQRLGGDLFDFELRGAERKRRESLLRLQRWYSGELGGVIWVLPDRRACHKRQDGDQDRGGQQGAIRTL